MDSWRFSFRTEHLRAWWNFLCVCCQSFNLRKQTEGSVEMSVCGIISVCQAVRRRFGSQDYLQTHLLFLGGVYLSKQISLCSCKSPETPSWIIQNIPVLTLTDTLYLFKRKQTSLFFLRDMWYLYISLSHRTHLFFHHVVLIFFFMSCGTYLFLCHVVLIYSSITWYSFISPCHVVLIYFSEHITWF